MDQNIKHIIFDFGGIIVDLDRQAAVQAFAALGLDAVGNIDNYVQSGVFSALETGRISSDDFYQWVCRTIGHHLERESVFAAWNCMLTGIPMERLRLIRRIKRDYHTYMLSNTNVLHWDYACQQLLSPAGAKLMREEVFDRIFLSFELHLAKPDPEIFLTVCDQADLLPSETFFIEDSAENCRAAQRLGMQVFHSREAEDWFGLFKEYGGEGIS